MEQAIRIQVIEFPNEVNPLPYVPAFCEWSSHVGLCVQCARVDQLAAIGQPFDPAALCEGGAMLQLTVSRRMSDQHQISLRN